MTNILQSVGQYLSATTVTKLTQAGTNVSGVKMAYVDTSEATTSTSYKIGRAHV